MKILKKINISIIALTIILNTLFLGLTLFKRFDSNILVCLSLYVIVFLPTIIRKIFKIKIANSVELVFLIFIFLAQLLGSVMHFYGIIYWYDSFVHFTSGLLTALFALLLLLMFKKYDEKSLTFNIFYMIAITLMVASIWELFEFSADNILGGDAQKVLTTGVTDTMKDVICALLGCSLICITYAYEIVNKTSLIVNKFLNNIKK
ncbi:MAG: DUF2238 domain-containing protein [Firmicutes bacterium]|nr:DUF2238 domain-containing protein [Bacillota bacterium]